MLPGGTELLAALGTVQELFPDLFQMKKAYPDPFKEHTGTPRVAPVATAPNASVAEALHAQHISR